MALFDAWSSAPNQRAGRWFVAWANAAIDARLPCVDVALDIDRGAAGWRDWAAAAIAEVEGQGVSDQLVKNISSGDRVVRSM